MKPNSLEDSIWISNKFGSFYIYSSRNMKAIWNGNDKNAY